MASNLLSWQYGPHIHHWHIYVWEVDCGAGTAGGGYEAYDTEHDGVSAWYNKATGERAGEFGQIPERTKEWLQAHEWRIDEVWVDKIAPEAKQFPVFLCGGGTNEAAVRAKCDKVIWLKTDGTTIRKRVGNPRDHDYGTQPHELERIIAGNKRKEKEYAALGATMIDATQPIDKVVAAILAAAEV